MTTIQITRRKQPIGFIRNITLMTKEGLKATVAVGETISLYTNFPEELYIKSLTSTKMIKTGINDNNAIEPIKAELFYNLSNYTILMMAVSMFILLGMTTVSIVRHYNFFVSPGIPIVIAIILIVKMKRNSLTIKTINHENI